MPRAGQVAAVVAAIFGCAVLPSGANAATPNLSWTGQANGLEAWSAAANWHGGKPAADETIGTLSFGALTKSCHKATRRACYFSYNDVPNLYVNGVDLADNVGYYSISGDPVTLGSGGITAVPSATLSAQRPSLTAGAGSQLLSGSGTARAPELLGRTRELPARRAPLVNGHFATDNFDFVGPSIFGPPLQLASPQTWTISAPASEDRYADDGLQVSSVTGNQPLAVNFTRGALLEMNGDAEIGALTAAGDGTLVGTELNATDGQDVTIGDHTALTLTDKDSGTGPLTVASGGDLELEQFLPPQTALSVNGGLTLAPGATLQQGISEPKSWSASSASEVDVAANAHIEGAKLDLSQYDDSYSGCADLHAGDVYTLLAVTGTLTGTFSNAPGGKSVTIHNSCDHSTTEAKAVIEYTTDSVLAKITSGGDAGRVPEPRTVPRLSGRLKVGHELTATTGKWTNHPTSYRYRWYRCSGSTGICTRIKHVNGDHYKLKAADLHRLIMVGVIAANSSGRSAENENERGPVTAAGKTGKILRGRVR